MFGRHSSPAPSECPEWFTVYLGGNIIIISEALFLDLGAKLALYCIIGTLFLVSLTMTVVITRRQNILVLGSTFS